jgi:hypothetical protein
MTKINAPTPPEKLFDLPVPHIYRDGSVSQINIACFESEAWTSDIPLSPNIMDENREHMIVLGSPEQARAMARALLIAADLCDKEMERQKGGRS